MLSHFIPLTNAVKDFTIEHPSVRFNEHVEQELQKMIAKRGADLESSTKTIESTPKKAAPPKDKSDHEKKLAIARSYVKALDALGLKEDVHYPREERELKKLEAGGGYRNIGTIEELYANLVTTKKGNDGTFYKLHLREHIDYVRRVAHEKASKLYNKVAFSSTPQTSLDILRAEVDSKLLDLAPEAAEKLMIAFKSVASDIPEEWTHALTSCRRFIEELGDALYPPKDESIKGRNVTKGQYINRLWAFMDTSIESESNKELAKAHVDYLGS
jgi:hypothetical protein